jgi:hypothetical protein
VQIKMAKDPNKSMHDKDCTAAGGVKRRSSLHADDMKGLAQHLSLFEEQVKVADTWFQRQEWWPEQVRVQRPLP